MRKSTFILMAICVAFGSCHRSEDRTTAAADDIVAQYRDSVLRLSDIERQLPSGISAEDSLRLKAAITDEWIDGFLIEDLAASQIDDLDRIDAMTARYRRSLISDSYRRKMRAQGVQPVDLNAVSKYYREHSKELQLERPIIKGLFIKLPSGSRHLEDIRLWMKEEGSETLDALENAGRLDGISFSYFEDQWIDFDILAEEIPFRIDDADQFVKENVDYETELNGTVYILHLTDYVSSGNPMPEQYAAPMIEDRMKALHLADYEEGLIKALRKTAMEKEILKTNF